MGIETDISVSRVERVKMREECLRRCSRKGAEHQGEAIWPFQIEGPTTEKVQFCQMRLRSSVLKMGYLCEQNTLNVM